MADEADPSEVGHNVMDSIGRPRVLFVYYTYTQQSLRVVEAMAGVLHERGCEVRQTGIEFTDKRWAERFSRFPLRHAYLDVLGMAPAPRRWTRPWPRGQGVRGTDRRHERQGAQSRTGGGSGWHGG